MTLRLFYFYVTIVISKLHPLERNVGCRLCRNSRFRVCKNVVTDTFDSVSTKRLQILIKALTIMTNASSTFPFVRDVVNNILVRPLLYCIVNLFSVGKKNSSGT